MKRRIRLSESDLHRIIKESVKSVLNEGGFTPLRWSSKYGLWDNTGQYDIDQAEYIDFDIMDDDELQTLYDEWLEQVGHTPRHKLGYARPDVAHALREIEKELEERGLR